MSGLTEYEREQLKLLEDSLYRDPDFKGTPGGLLPEIRARYVLSTLIFLGGLLGLVAAMVLASVPAGVLAFVVMLAGSVNGYRAYRLSRGDGLLDLDEPHLDWPTPSRD